MRLAPRAIAFDLDGTLYRGAEAVPGAVRLLRDLSARFEIVYITNSTVRSGPEIAALLSGMGYLAESSRVYTSGAAAARYVRDADYLGVYVVGAPPLVDVMRDAGVPRSATAAEADAMVVGLDPDWRAHCAGIESLPPTAPRIACNLDDTYPVEGGRRRSGCGAVVRQIEALLGRSHDVVIGKPGTYMLELAFGDMGLSPADVVLVGDTEASDIAAARAAGCASVLIAPEHRGSSYADATVADITGLADVLA